MRRTYSTYETKAHFSEVMRQVRAGHTVTVTYRGRPTAEIRPLPVRKSEDWVGDWLDDLEDRGMLTRATAPHRPLGPIARVPGAVARFLAEREED